MIYRGVRSSGGVLIGHFQQFYSQQDQNDCMQGWNDAWNQFCSIGLATYPNPDAASCPLNKNN